MKLNASTPEKRLKLLLIDRDLEFADVAKGTGLSISLIEKIATRKATPTRRTIARLETFLNERVFSSPATFRARQKAFADTKTAKPATVETPAGENAEIIEFNEL